MIKSAISFRGCTRRKILIYYVKPYTLKNELCLPSKQGSLLCNVIVDIYRYLEMTGSKMKTPSFLYPTTFNTTDIEFSCISQSFFGKTTFVISVDKKLLPSGEANFIFKCVRYKLLFCYFSKIRLKKQNYTNLASLKCFLVLLQFQHSQRNCGHCKTGSIDLVRKRCTRNYNIFPVCRCDAPRTSDQGPRVLFLLMFSGHF